jgi:hypothetical protein
VQDDDLPLILRQLFDSKLKLALSMVVLCGRIKPRDLGI